MVLVLGVLVGMLGVMVTEEGWGFWRSLYFTVITISTVGYGDEGISDAGKCFAIVLILFGIGTFTYALTQLVQRAVGRGLAWRKKMQRQIDLLRDHFIICGVGRVGQTVCERFTEAAIPVVVVEKDEDRASWARDHGHLAVDGTATEDEVLVRAGIDRARGIVCVTSCDADNLMITLSAREINPATTIISRVSDPNSMKKFKNAGSTHVISPSTNGGNDIASMLIRPRLLDFLNHARNGDSGYQLTEITIENGSSLVGQTFEQFGSWERSIVFVAVQRPDGDTRIRPTVSDAFCAGDVVIVVGELEAIVRISELARGQAITAAAG